METYSIKIHQSNGYVIETKQVGSYITRTTTIDSKPLVVGTHLITLLTSRVDNYIKPKIKIV